MRHLMTVVLGCALFAPVAFGQGAESRLRLTLLGTGTPTPSAERMGACLLVETATQHLLFDAGRGCVIRLDQVHIAWPQLTDVFLTHLHADHTFSVGDVYLMGWVLGRTQPLTIRGPTGTQALMTHTAQALEIDIASRAANGRQLPTYSVTEITPGVVYERDGLSVRAFEVDHTVKPAYGYRIEYAGHSAVFSGDTRYSENLIAQAKGVDVLVHEVVAAGTNPTPQQRYVLAGHTQPAEAGRVFEQVRPKLAVYTHVLLLAGASAADVMAATQRAYNGRVEMGVDLMTIEISDAGVRVQRPDR
jgi:ribonuclease Z